MPAVLPCFSGRAASAADYPMCTQINQAFPASQQSSASFKWRDYSPVVFQHLREIFGLESRDYLLSLAGDRCAQAGRGLAASEASRLILCPALLMLCLEPCARCAIGGWHQCSLPSRGLLLSGWGQMLPCCWSRGHLHDSKPGMRARAERRTQQMRLPWVQGSAARTLDVAPPPPAQLPPGGGSPPPTAARVLVAEVWACDGCGCQVEGPEHKQQLLPAVQVKGRLQSPDP